MLAHVDNRITYSGNGSATEFAYQFKILDRTDIKVLLTDADGKEKLLTKDYYVDVEKNVVRYPGYAVGAEVPESERPPVLPIGWKLTIYREVPVTQETDLPDQYPFNQVEDIGDKLTMIAQQLTDVTSRSLKISVSKSADIDTTIPWENGKSFRISDDGKTLELTEDPARVLPLAQEAYAQAQAQAQSAAASAAAAAQSEDSAAASASEAGNSAQSASVSAASAVESAELTSGYKQEALTAKNAAAASATNAKASEANAKTSENNAEASKEAAQSAASNANNFATSASSSASEAKSYRDAANNYAANAKNYSENVNVFLPSVSSAGVLSWTNKAGLDNPASVNIKGAKGDKGDTGTAATIEVGTVTTGAAGSSASVVNRGDANHAILDFILPKGADGKGSVITVNGKEPDAGGNVNVANMTGASDLAAGKAGLVPAPAAGMQNKFLCADATWKDAGGLPVGHEFFTTNPNIPAGCIPLLGGEYSRTAYADLWAWVQTQEGYLIEESAWQAKAAVNGGNVPFYSKGDGTTTFRVPSLKCWVKGANGIEEVGSYLSAGLPILPDMSHTHERGTMNITGEITYITAEDGNISDSSYPTTGAFRWRNEAYTKMASLASGTGSRDLSFDASRSWTGATSSASLTRTTDIYGNSDTVQPKSIVGMWLVKAYGTVTNVGSTDVANIAQGLTELETRVVPIEKGGTGATTANDACNNLGLSWDYLHRYGENFVPNDTSNHGWNSLGVFSSYYTQTGKIKNQPTQYGQLLNIPADKGDESTQIWIEQSSGRIYFRGGDGVRALDDIPFKKVATTEDGDITSKISVTAGTVAHNGTIPLPSGYSRSQCKYAVWCHNMPDSNAGYGEATGGTSWHKVQVNQTTGVVYCRYQYDGSHQVDGTAGYLCIAVK